MNERILRSLQGQATAAEEQELAAWRAASPSNEQHYRATERLWQLTAAAEPLAVPPRPRASELLGHASTRRAIPFRRATHASRRESGAVWTRRGVAAAAAILALLSIAQLWSGLADRPREFATGAGEMTTVRLEDGSVVRLAPESRLRVDEGNDREVWLDGRAFFAVTQQSGRPFVVHTAAGDAQVLGTRFELRADESDVRLAVVEGRVALSGSQGRVEVQAGEISHVRQGQEPSPARPANVEALVEWMGRTLIFEATPLHQVAQEIERLYGVPIRLGPDAALADRTVTAVFDDRSLQEVIATVCRVVNSECEVHDSAVVVHP